MNVLSGNRVNSSPNRILLNKIDLVHTGYMESTGAYSIAGLTGFDGWEVRLEGLQVCAGEKRTFTYCYVRPQFSLINI